MFFGRRCEKSVDLYKTRHANCEETCCMICQCLLPTAAYWDRQETEGGKNMMQHTTRVERILYLFYWALFKVFSPFNNNGFIFLIAFKNACSFVINAAYVSFWSMYFKSLVICHDNKGWIQKHTSYSRVFYFCNYSTILHFLSKQQQQQQQHCRLPHYITAFRFRGLKGDCC